MEEESSLPGAASAEVLPLCGGSDGDFIALITAKRLRNFLRSCVKVEDDVDGMVEKAVCVRAGEKAMGEILVQWHFSVGDKV